MQPSNHECWSCSIYVGVYPFFGAVTRIREKKRVGSADKSRLFNETANLLEENRICLCAIIRLRTGMESFRNER